MLSTTHKPVDSTLSGLEMDIKGQTIIRKRKRPKATSSAARTSRKPFGNSHTKDLRIPTVYDDYNHHMNSVDISDQLRVGMQCFRPIRKGGWRTLWHFLFNLTLVDSYLLSGFKSQFEFRNALLGQLLKKGTSTSLDSGLDLASGAGARKRRKLPNNRARPSSKGEHQEKGHKLGYRESLQRCSQCRDPPQRRPVLGEKSNNIQSRNMVRKTPATARFKRSRYGCIICNIALCKEAIASILM